MSHDRSLRPYNSDSYYCKYKCQNLFVNPLWRDDGIHSRSPINKNMCNLHFVSLLECFIFQVYTTKGLEIARVTVIDDRLNVMFDSFIKPAAEVIDYNTRYVM